MSRTDKDAPKRLYTDEDWDTWYRQRNPRKNPHPKRGKLQAREYPAGPGGVKCSCCGVQKNYKKRDRRSWKVEAFSYVSLLSM